MSKKRLLVIEDDFDVAEMLHVYFAAQGYEVLNAYTGGDGIGMARAKSPNLILLDVMLPDMDGFDVCRTLRHTALTKYIPVIFLTQRDRRADKVAGLELGADDYITKPFDIDELRLRVQGSLRRASRESLNDALTGLPSAPIIREMESWLRNFGGWRRLDIQVVGFRAFRDVYGFVAASETQTFIGQVLIETIAERGTPDDFAGVHQEDHYVVFTFAEDHEQLIDALVNRFNHEARKFYNFIDSDRGYVIINEAHDDEQFIPLMHFTLRQSVGPDIARRPPRESPQAEPGSESATSSV